MAKNTANLLLYEKEATDGNDTFNITTMLNENWDKIDKFAGEAKNDIANISVPVKSVNGKTGDIVLSASDIDAADGSSIESQLADKANQILNIERALSMGGMI